MERSHRLSEGRATLPSPNSEQQKGYTTLPLYIECLSLRLYPMIPVKVPLGDLPKRRDRSTRPTHDKIGADTTVLPRSPEANLNTNYVVKIFLCTTPRPTMIGRELSWTFFWSRYPWNVRSRFLPSPVTVSQDPSYRDMGSN